MTFPNSSKTLPVSCLYSTPGGVKMTLIVPLSYGVAAQLDGDLTTRRKKYLLPINHQEA